MPRLLLVRHGESTWNAASRWQGQADPPLSELGERQAEVAKRAVTGFAPVVVVASDLQRARRTAELLTPDGVELRVEPDLREREAGEWTGLTREEIEEHYPGALGAKERPPGFEPDGPLMKRALAALARVVATLGPDDVAVLVTHGGVIGTLERRLAGRKGPIPNLGGRWVHADGDDLVLGERELLVDPDDVEVTIPGQI